MRTTHISVAVAGALVTGAVALVAADGAGLFPYEFVNALPPWLTAAAPWAWKVAAVLVVGYVALAVFGGRAPAGDDGHVTVITPPPPEPSATAMFPAPPDPHLPHAVLGGGDVAGREAGRQALTAWLKGRKGPAVQVVTGPPGIGKSALAWAWTMGDVLGRQPAAPGETAEVRKACRLAPRSRPHGVLWWSFDRQGAGFSMFLDEAIGYLSAGAVGPGSYLSSRFEKVETLLSHLREKKFLIVLDAFERELRGFARLDAGYRGNELERAEAPDAAVCADLHAAEFLRRVVEHPTSSRILITSRLLPSDVGTAGAAHMPLGGLEPHEAAALLRKLGVEGDDDELRAACNPYGGHPLALHLLAGVATDGRGAGRARNARRIGAPSRGGGAAVQHVVEAAIDVLDAKPRRLLGHLAVFRGVINEAESLMFDPGGGRPLDETRDELVRRGLLLTDGGSYRMHALVRRSAYARLADPARVHGHLARYYGQTRLPAQIKRIQELVPALEQFHHLAGAGRYEEAYTLLSGRLIATLRERFADQQTLMQLLSGLFDGATPLLAEKPDRAWAVDALAKACSYSGETSRALALCEANIGAFESKRDQEFLVTLLGDLSGVEARLGRLEPAETHLRRLVELTNRLERPAEEAIARNRLGLLLATRGAFDEALAELDGAFAMTRDGDRQIQSVCFSYYAQRALLMGDAEAALESSRKARAFVEEVARRGEPNEHDYVRSGWLLSASLIALGAGGTDGTVRLEEAERYLSDALSRCRRNDLVGFEPDLLLTRARWCRAGGKRKEAERFARDALALAERCEYRLKRAEINNFLCRLALDAGRKDEAIELARIAWDLAWCDGPPYALTPALDAAEALLRELGVTSSDEPGDDAQEASSKAA